MGLKRETVQGMQSRVISPRRERYLTACDLFLHTHPMCVHVSDSEESDLEEALPMWSRHDVLPIIPRGRTLPDKGGGWRLDDFDVGKRLNKGAFGKVYVVKEKRTQTLYALKVIHKKKQRPDQARQLKREIDAHEVVRSKNVIRMFGHFHDPERVFLVLEYTSKGNLYDLLQRRGAFTPAVAAKVPLTPSLCY